MAHTRPAPLTLLPSTQDLACHFGDLATGLLRLLPAETAHELALELMSRGWLEYLPAPRVSGLGSGMRVEVPGLGTLAHPLGLAAGFDKNALAPRAFSRLGFTFLEIGTVTPRPQPGNPKPRLFRQPEQRALINRMGFNSDGATTVADRLARLNWHPDEAPLGINCGKNKDTPPERAIADYLQVIETCRTVARYFVINISSPNTPGLRDLATPEFIGQLADELGASLLAKVWVKLDPDRPRRELQALVAALADRGFQGVILSNTHRVTAPEVGGQSGQPLTALATSCLEWAYEVHRGALPMVASGGVLSGADVYARLARGALAVQVYTALVYRGPWTVVKLLTELDHELRLRGLATVQDAIGSYYQE